MIILSPSREKKKAARRLERWNKEGENYGVGVPSQNPSSFALEQASGGGASTLKWCSCWPARLGPAVTRRKEPLSALSVACLTHLRACPHTTAPGQLQVSGLPGRWGKARGNALGESGLPRHKGFQLSPRPAVSATRDTSQKALQPHWR